jgi:KilA-N domain
MQATSLIKSYKGKNIRIRADKFVCITDMATASGKQLGGWTRLKGTNEYLEALSEAMQICIGELLEVENGTTTWAHPEVAVEFASWCSVGFKIQVNQWVLELMTVGSVSIAPKTPLELAKEQVRLHEQLELQAAHIAILEQETERQSEIIDELFDYSSIVRIAIYNKIDEKEFNWRQLKAASTVKGLEVKKAPCPRFVTKNLYSHDDWRLAYPGITLPETITLVLAK